MGTLQPSRSSKWRAIPQSPIMLRRAVKWTPWVLFKRLFRTLRDAKVEYALTVVASQSLCFKMPCVKQRPGSERELWTFLFCRSPWELGEVYTIPPNFISAKTFQSRLAWREGLTSSLPLIRHGWQVKRGESKFMSLLGGDHTIECWSRMGELWV